jgi:hypothetical protein
MNTSPAVRWSVLVEFVFGGFEDAVQAAEDGHGEDDSAVFVGFIGATQEVGDVPDEVCVFAEVGHRGSVGSISLHGISAWESLGVRSL